MTYNPKLIREEKDLFNFIKNNFIPDLIPTELRKRYDCFSEFYQMDIELKCRRKHYSKLLIEKPKYPGWLNTWAMSATAAMSTLTAIVYCKPATMA